MNSRSPTCAMWAVEREDTIILLVLVVNLLQSQSNEYATLLPGLNRWLYDTE